MKSRFARFAAALAVGLATVSASAALTSAKVNVDGRGLVDIPGVLRMGNGAHWGFANLIAFGPGWGYAAQDYAMAGGKKSGNSYTGRLRVPRAKVQVSENWQTVKGTAGEQAFQMTWTLENPEGQPLGLEKAYIMMPLAIENFGGAVIESADGKTATFPVEKTDAKADNVASFWGTSGVTIKGHNKEGKETTFRVFGSNLGIEITDSRHEKADKTYYQVRVLFPSAKTSAKSTLTLKLSATYAPFSFKPGDDWVPFEFMNVAAPGSILDWSAFHQNDAPAGKYGRIVVDADGHYSYEKTGKRVRLVGANLCFDANFTDKAKADGIVAAFKSMGYNAVRFHHLDVVIMKGQWNGFWSRTTRPTLDPAQLDRLDYLFAAMKKAGMYSTIDLYAMGCFGQIPGVKGTVYGDIKGLVPICPAAFDVWSKAALELLDHVNPYTGIAWKDDPALVAICPLNEASIASVWAGGQCKPLYEKAFADWKAKSARAGRDDKQLLAQFLTETKVASNNKIRAFFKEHGVKALMSGSNWWDTMAQTFERDSLDVVDNHQYADHPKGGYQSLPTGFDAASTMRSGRPTYMVPVFMAATRVFGKPFVVTEWNYCVPNPFRAEAGVMMGGVASLQDWDALYRFAWTHGSDVYDGQPHHLGGFDIARDPIGMFSERLLVLLFGRGDMKPGAQKFVYGVTMDEATQGGVGDMWGRGLFPHDFNALALLHQVGSQVVEGGRPVKGKFNGVVSGATLTPAQLAGNPYIAKKALVPCPKLPVNGEFRADTDEFALDNKAGTVRITTPRTCAIAAPAGKDLTAGALSVAGATTFASTSASAMDGQPLASSSRVLLLHITDVVDTDMGFDGPGRHSLVTWGKLPHLAKTGSVNVTFRSAVPGLTLYALKSDGTRAAKVPAAYANGAYTFTLAIKPGDAAPTMLYELAAR